MILEANHGYFVRTWLRLTLIPLFLFAHSSFAAYQFGFGNVSLNHLNWTDGTKRKSPKQDFAYLELEGGAQFDWGDLYGFYDIENIGHTGSEMRAATKGALNYYLGTSGLTIYAQVYDFSSKGFAEQERVVGFGYNLKSENWWFKPYLGFNTVTQTFYTGPNGYMGGWIAGYNFTVLQQKFLAANWHEWEFARNGEYAAGNGGSTTSHNGAVALFWNAPAAITLGIQWRYGQDKLGTPGALGAVISTLKYNF